MKGIKLPDFSAAAQSYIQSLDINQIIHRAIQVPGVKIDRAAFLRKELIKYYSEDTVAEAIRYNPARAGIPRSAIDTLAKNAIDYETNKVTALSALASLPGGIAAIGSVSADMVSYYAHILRIVQKLSYLYGFPEFQLKEDSIDEETLNYILVFVGIMFGVQGASETANKIAAKVADNVARKLPQKALNKSVINPIFGKVLSKIGAKTSKQTVADLFASAVPLVGAAFSGGLTYVTFMPRCYKLRNTLRKYRLCDTEFYAKENRLEPEPKKKTPEMS